MPTTLAFVLSPEDMDEDFFGVPVLSWRDATDDDATPPSPERPTAAPVAAR